MFTSDIIIVSGYHGYIFFVVTLVSLLSHFKCNHLDITDCKNLKSQRREWHYVAFGKNFCKNSFRVSPVTMRGRVEWEREREDKNVHAYFYAALFKILYE
jgi:hypothetical protein